MYFGFVGSHSLQTSASFGDFGVRAGKKEQRPVYMTSHEIISNQENGSFVYILIPVQIKNQAYIHQAYVISV
jgi:hypothetical protein